MILRSYNSCNIGAVTRMTEDITKMISIRGAFKGHCTQDFKKAEKLIAAKDSDPAELEALVDRLTRRAGEIIKQETFFAMKSKKEIECFSITRLARNLLLQA